MAVLAVVAFHYGHLGGGFLGVDLFFVLSGLLITRVLLVRRADSGSFSLAWFWMRRARRLLPAVAVLLVVVQIWVHYLHSTSLARLTHEQGRAALAYGSNWYNVLVHLGHGDVGLSQTPLTHLWSLAIEEQFYLVWPLLAVPFLRRRFYPRALGAVALGMALVAYAVAPFIADSYGFNAAYFGTGSRAGALLLGCALALFSWRRVGVAPTACTGWRRWALDAAAAGCAAALGYYWCAASLNLNLFHGPLVVCGVSAGVLIWSVLVNGDGLVARGLALPPLTYVGKRSYSLYLWHFPVLVLVSAQHTSMHGTTLLVARILLTAAATEVSYRLVENPVRRSGIRAVRLVPSLALAAAVVAGLSLWAPVQQTSAPAANTSFVNAQVPAQAANLRVMVVGDSWGQRTALGLRSMHSPRPAQVFDDALRNCGVADPTRMVAEYGTIKPTAECLNWRARWRTTLTTQRPDAVIMVVGNSDQAPLEFNGDGTFHDTCDDAFISRYAARLDEALTLLTSTGVPVFVTTVVDNGGTATHKSTCMNQLLTDAVTRNAKRGVNLLDVHSLLCPGPIKPSTTTHAANCPLFIDGKRVYDDTWHLDLGTQVGVNAWQLEQILKVVTPASQATASDPLRDAVSDALSQTIGNFRGATISFPSASSTSEPFVQLAAALRRAQPNKSVTAVVSGASTTAAARVYAYQFPTDAQADALARQVLKALNRAHAVLTLGSPNLELGQFSAPGQQTKTIGVLRTWRYAVFVEVTGRAATPQLSRATAYLAALSPAIGGR